MAAVTQEFPQVRSARPGETPGELNDHYLVAQAKRGDNVAYDRIVRRYRSFVRLKASSYFLLGGESDDLIQEGLVGLYKAVRDFRTDRESARAIAAIFAATPLVVTAKAGAAGKLFGSITASDIVAGVEQQFHVVVDRKHVEIAAPIRELGTHQVTIGLYGDVRGTLTVEVRAV